MRLTILIDRTIPKNEIPKVLYVWELVAKLIGVSTEITNEMNENIRSSERIFAIYYGYLHNIPKPIFDLIIPYEPFRTLTKIKYIQNVPVLYHSKEPPYLIHENKFGFDIITLIFYLLSGYDEYISNEMDTLGRHLVKNSVCYKFKLFELPLVNIYVNFIKEKISGKFNNCFLPLWKENKPFAVVLSHDVDTISRYSVTNSIAFFKKGLNASAFTCKIKFAGYALISLLMTPSKYFLKSETWGFEKIVQLENKYNVRSTFFFLPLPPDAVNHHDMPYSYNERIFYRNKWTKLKDIINDMYRHGYGIGLHAGVDSFCNINILLQQKESLQRLLNIKLKTVRQHYLSFRNDDTWKTHEQACFKCDSSYGFNEIIGLRNSFCYPYKPFSFSENRQLCLWEVPLAIQDNALFLSEKQDGESYHEKAIKLLQKIKEMNGVAVLLWHINTSGNKRCHNWFDTYEEIIKWAISENAFVGSVEEIIKWWEYRDKKITVTCKI